MSNIKLFESNQIRSVWNETDQTWYFVVEDVVSVLTDSNDPKQYVKRMRQRDKELAKEVVLKVTKDKLNTKPLRHKVLVFKAFFFVPLCLCV